MKIESTAFTVDDVRSFMASYRDHEREVLARRLEDVSRRLAVLAPHIGSAGSNGDGWNAHEVLAHIAVVSKFYGVLVHKIASGQVTELDLLESVHMRDAAGEQMAALKDEELVKMALADQERTIKTLRRLDAESLGRSALMSGEVTMTAEEVARLPLISHLELHLDQLEGLLGS
ncbi:MAG TPA: DinB family protein [Candidatus Dormibacteraeota bacterium]|nr:DinB family protein [Candidatus Dormibacteraeota bacterium]